MTQMLAVRCISFNREVQCTIDSRCVNLFKEFKTARANAENLFYSSKVNEFLLTLTTSEPMSWYTGR